MQYYNGENAEYLMKQMASTKQDRHRIWSQSVSEHNGVKCATDGYRAAVILPEGVADWDLSNAYFETGDAGKPRFELNRIFNQRDEDGLCFNLSKEQTALLLVSIDGAKTDHHRKFVSLPATEKDCKWHEAIVCVDMNKMGIITEATALELRGQAGDPIMAFNARLIEEALKFLMCSDDGNIELFHNGNLSGLIMRSGRLYAMVLPARLKDDAK